MIISVCTYENIAKPKKISNRMEAININANSGKFKLKQENNERNELEMSTL